MNRHLKCLISTLCMLCICLVTSAQMSYNRDNNKFVVNTANAIFMSESDYGCELNGFHKLRLQNSDSRFTINCKNTFTYIYSSSWVVEFYNRTTGVFNDMRGMDFRTSANGEVYPALSQNSLQLITSLTPVKYSDGEEYSSYGLIPEEVEAYLPESVHTSPDGQKGIDYISLLPTLANSILELKEKVEDNAVLINKLISNQ